MRYVKKVRWPWLLPLMTHCHCRLGHRPSHRHHIRYRAVRQAAFVCQAWRSNRWKHHHHVPVLWNRWAVSPKRRSKSPCRTMKRARNAIHHRATMKVHMMTVNIDIFDLIMNNDRWQFSCCSHFDSQFFFLCCNDLWISQLIFRLGLAFSSGTRCTSFSNP